MGALFPGRLTISHNIRQSPANKDVSMEAQECPLLEAATKQQPVEIMSD
jgi:hypothetical protein